MEVPNLSSLDLTASPDAVSQELLHVSPGSRRSVSIFSRKGTESPIARQSSLDTVFSSPSQTPTRQKSRIMRTISSSSATRSSKATSPKTPKSSKGTVLNAVPPAKVIQMTRLEEEMAWSPNEEILSAINERDLTMTVLNNTEQSPRVSPLQQETLAPTSTLSTRRVGSQRRAHSQKNRIGVWINGVAHWDDYVACDSPKQRKMEVSNMTATRPVSAGSGETAQRQAKPLLSVVIPTGGPLINDDTISNIVQPKPHPNRPVLAITPVAFKPSRPSHVVELVQSKGDISSDKSSRQQKPSGAPKTPYPEHSRSGSTSGSSVYTDDESDNSRRSSSATSVEVLADEEPLPTPGQPNKDKPLPPLPKAKAPRGVSVPPPKKGQSAKTVTLLSNVDIVKQYAVVRPRRSMSTLDRFDREFLKTSPYAFPKAPSTVSPTLSEAEQELVDSLDMSSQTLERHQLKELVADSLSQRSNSLVQRSDSVRDVMQPPVETPVIPKRSRKRDWRLSKDAKASANTSRPEAPTRRYSDDYHGSLDLAGYHGLVELAKDQTLRKSASFPATEEQKKGPVDTKIPAFTEWAKQLPQSAASLRSQSVTSLRSTDRSPTRAYASTSAENVLLHILASLHSKKDLFNTAIINKGMYRVFKENEMDLIRTVTYNQCPTAWELREWSPPLGDQESSPEGSPRTSTQLEHSPTSYMRESRRDWAVIKRLKVLVLEKCQTFLRKETKFALMHPNHPSATWVDDAFYRIWSFCKIFGCNKGREEDITGQLDWLKGGLLANNQGCVATVNTNLDFDMGSVLLNPPEHFAKANKGGLQQSQLFDMTEIWSSLAVLLQGYQGRVKQARSYGIFDGTGVLEGNVEQEELLLEEWLAYLLTLGPDVVLEMAEHAADAGDIGFAVARAWGWTKWTPPTHSGSRTNFLKEPVAKCYEEQIVSAKEKRLDPLEQELKEKRRQRVANMAAEIRLRRQTSEYQRSPMIDMASERPMSIFSIKSTAPSQKTMVSRTNTKKRPSTLASKPVSRPVSVTSPTTPLPLYSAAPKTISPIDEQVEPPKPAAVRAIESKVEDPSDKAVQTIVSMGFTRIEANNALRITDMGDGIRLDRAVEWCLKQRW